MRTLILLIVLGWMSGCGSIFGVKEFEAWEGGPRFQFAEGMDAHIGTNQVNQVDNRRGLSTRQGSYIRDVKY